MALPNEKAKPLFFIMHRNAAAMPHVSATMTYLPYTPPWGSLLPNKRRLLWSWPVGTGHILPRITDGSKSKPIPGPFNSRGVNFEMCLAPRQHFFSHMTLPAQPSHLLSSQVSRYPTRHTTHDTQHIHTTSECWDGCIIRRIESGMWLARDAEVENYGGELGRQIEKKKKDKKTQLPHFFGPKRPRHQTAVMLRGPICH
ncbi:uncharacterized protein BCR38DRAFT_242107 [Pseudomassariella vexata]|uniref:Uncharacterized protein n=1 Tax=Pseudomassariella vexata TaxID=1141098 RepID=A0A1Y2DTN9_9PEZI|nr:uncharacterized protein BCR38DRAFT_242107 [Pseudomassariella vexata]ORY62539.1 hypothetical protein BCR38DRAFT_242107 [Pseudomassariella vexata]